jgi:hypothetical protein
LGGEQGGHRQHVLFHLAREATEYNENRGAGYMTDKDATQKASKESVRPLEGRRVLVVEHECEEKNQLIG